MGRAVKRIVYDETAIASKVKEMGAAISAAYPEGDKAPSRGAWYPSAAAACAKVSS